MPQIELIPVPLYQSLDPYHKEIDNLPIEGLIDRILLVNDQVDLDATELRTSQGTTGSLTTRLAVSINDDGTLKATGVNSANHSIESHADTTDYVRMLATERSKLSLVAAGATNTSLLFQTENVGDVGFSSGTVTLNGSSTVTWRYTSGKVYADTTFPGIGHRINQTPTTADYSTYTLPISGGYNSGTLRVFVNGYRIATGFTVYIPNRASPPTTWTALSYSETTPASGTFSLSASIGATGKIIVDYDYSY